MGLCHQIIDIIAAHCRAILFNYLHPITKQELMIQSTFHWYFAFFHVRYLSYVVLQVFWIGNLLRFDQRARVAATICAPSWCSSILEWEQVFENCCRKTWIAVLFFCLHLVSCRPKTYGSVECHFCAPVMIYWSLSFSHNQLVQDL